MKDARDEEIARLKNANRRLLMLLEEEKRKHQEGK